MSETTKVAVRDESLKALLEAPGYRRRINEVLGDRAPQFCSSLVAISQSYRLAQCEPKSLLAAGMQAAMLDLPIQPSLGFAHVVPYKRLAQFQMGYKGYIQLGLRSGQFRRLGAIPINAGVWRGTDMFGDPILDMSGWDETKPAVGYMVAWELANGFTKAVYWSREKMLAHAERYSQAYQAQKKDSPWFTNFDAMALKTVLSNSLRRWAPLSVQMQRALVVDQTAQADMDAEPVYLDGPGGDDAEPVLESSAKPVSAARPAPARDGETIAPGPMRPATEPAASSPATAAEVAPDGDGLPLLSVSEIKEAITQAGLTEARVVLALIEGDDAWLRQGQGLGALQNWQRHQLVNSIIPKLAKGGQ